MLDLLEIRSHLESPSIKKRTNFIENYDFEDSYHDFYATYLKENLPLPNRDNWYVIAMVELAQDLGIFDPQIRTILWELYEAKKNAVYLKLAILDYLAAFPFGESDKTEIIPKYETYWKRTRNDLLKNQLICNLLHLEPENTVYQIRLLTQIPKTQNYRSLIRILNFFAEQPILPEVIERVKLAIRQHELAQYESVRAALEK